MTSFPQTFVLLGLLTAACTGQDRPAQTAARDSAAAPAGATAAAPDTTPPADSPSTPSSPPPAPAGSRTAPAPIPDARVMLGRWVLRRIPEIPRAPQLALAVDSITSNRFRTRIAFYMAGDVGAEPSSFRPEWGSLSAGSIAVFPLAYRASGSALGEIIGHVAGDTVRVIRFQWAGEDRLAMGGRWLLLKEK